MKTVFHKRTLKEAEGIIKTLQDKCWKQDDAIRGMRMALYYTNKSLQEIDDELNAIWVHHQDGSDLLVSKEELFDVIQNKIRNKICWREKKIEEALKKLKEFIGW